MNVVLLPLAALYPTDNQFELHRVRWLNFVYLTNLSSLDALVELYPTDNQFELHWMRWLNYILHLHQFELQLDALVELCPALAPI